MAWEQALFINYSGRAFLCPRKIGDVGERFAGDLAQITIGAGRLTDLSQLTFLKASY